MILEEASRWINRALWYWQMKKKWIVSKLWVVGRERKWAVWYVKSLNGRGSTRRNGRIALWRWKGWRSTSTKTELGGPFFMWNLRIRFRIILAPRSIVLDVFYVITYIILWAYRTTYITGDKIVPTQLNCDANLDLVNFPVLRKKEGKTPGALRGLMQDHV